MRSLLVISTFFLGFAVCNPAIENFRNIPKVQGNKFHGESNHLDQHHAQKAIKDVRATINEVQRLLALDPTLPRLTRGEIEELFENVTREELHKSILRGDKKRELHMRALMVALPLHANEVQFNQIKKPFPRPPTARILEPKTKRTTTIRAVTFPTTTVPPLPPLFLPVKRATTIRPTTFRPTTFHPNHYTVTTKAKPTSTKPPTRRYGDVDAKGNPITFTYKPLIEIPIIRQVSSVDDILANIELNNKRARAAYFATSTTTQAPTTTTTALPLPPPIKPLQIKPEDLRGLLKNIGVVQRDETRGGIEQAIDIPYVPEHEINPYFSNLNQGYFNVDKDFRLPGPVFDNNFGESESRPQYVIAPVTTTSTTSTTTHKPQINTPKIVGADFQQFKPLPKTGFKKLQSDVQELLESYGILELPRNKKALQPIVVPDDDLEITTTTQEITTTPSTTKPLIEKMINAPELDENLPIPDDLLDVLQTLGIAGPQRSPQRRFMEVTSSTTEATTTTTKKFKPRRYTRPTDLPQKETTAKFSYSRGVARRRTSTTTSTTVKSPVYVAEKTEEKETNIFNPSESIKQKEDYTKLEHLLQTIRELDKLQGNLTDSQLERLNLSNIKTSETLLNQEGPDPLDELDLHIKNEIKRQGEEGSTTKEEPTKITLDLLDVAGEARGSSQKSTTPLDQIDMDDDDNDKKSTTTSTTERTASADELKDSFPNDKDAEDPVDESLPPPRKNGFYFLADWNSFLEVGQDEQKVIVKFDPKVGDPSRFIPVEIPSKL